jgi:glycosyltransferase involved in cell wall biosynthesis
MDLVSVIIPAQNRPQMLRQAVLSVVAQTYKPIEIIIVLAGATEQVIGMASDIASEHGARLLHQGKLNAGAARNAGLSIARGEWISFLDDDDLFIPEKISAQMQVALSTGCDIVSSNSVTFFDDGRPDALWMPPGRLPTPVEIDFRTASILGSYVNIASLVKTSVLKQVGGFDPSLRTCEDWDLWRRVVQNHRIEYIDRPLIRIRNHSGNTSGSRWLMQKFKFKHLFKMWFDVPQDLRHALWTSVGHSLYGLAACAAFSIMPPEKPIWIVARRIKRYCFGYVRS